MGSSPGFKIYTADREYIGAVKYASDAAALVALYGEGATVRDGHRLKDAVWTEGKEADLAGNSYDAAAATIYERRESRA